MTGAADRFVIGAIGPPGRRTFLIQVVVGEDSSWYVIEKLQAAAFADQAAELLDAIDRAGAGRSIDPGSLDPPQEVAFRAGAVSLEYLADRDLVRIEVFPIERDDEPIDEEPAAFTVTPAQLDAAAQEALRVVDRGRPRCPRCSLAMDPDGHVCPGDNGDLRSHQP